MPSRKATRPDDKRIAANRSRQPAPPPSRYQMLLSGALSVEDLDDEEILAGKCKDKNGHFTGRPPATFPRALHDAMRAEFQKRVQEKFNEGTEVALNTLTDVMQSRQAAAPARVRAAEVWLERVMGKVPDKVMASIEMKPYEQDIDDLLVDVEENGVHVVTTMPRKESA